MPNWSFNILLEYKELNCVDFCSERIGTSSAWHNVKEPIKQKKLQKEYNKILNTLNVLESYSTCLMQSKWILPKQCFKCLPFLFTPSTCSSRQHTFTDSLIAKAGQHHWGLPSLIPQFRAGQTEEIAKGHVQLGSE